MGPGMGPGGPPGGHKGRSAWPPPMSVFGTGLGRAHVVCVWYRRGHTACGVFGTDLGIARVLYLVLRAEERTCMPMPCLILDPPRPATTVGWP
eukprot:3699650-Rhodomonas_salina.1